MLLAFSSLLSVSDGWRRSGVSAGVAGWRGGLLPYPRSSPECCCCVVVIGIAAAAGGDGLCGCKWAMGTGDGRELGGFPCSLYLDEASVRGRVGGCSGDFGTSPLACRCVKDWGSTGNLAKMFLGAGVCAAGGSSLLKWTVLGIGIVP